MLRHNFGLAWGEFTGRFRQGFSEYEADRIFGFVNSLDSGEVKDALHALADTMSRKPTIHEMLQVLLPLRQKFHERRRNERIAQGAALCAYCHGTGMVCCFVTAIKNKTCSFQCGECESAEVMGITQKHFAKWNIPMANRYLPMASGLTSRSKKETQPLLSKFHQSAKSEREDLSKTHGWLAFTHEQWQKFIPKNKRVLK